ncbi:MAG: patatin-like phospholipase family protein [Gemmatimonadota bacterium]
MIESPFTLVLSGGGMKGLAHIGVLRALEQRGLVPSLVVGTSMGSLVGATWATGMSTAEMVERARAIRKRDVFQIAHADMALRRMRAPAVYRKEPLDLLLQSLIGDLTFDDLKHPLLINTVDINSGSQVLWGRPGFRKVKVRDAVFASCALPGILPPREVGGRYCVDGAVIDTLPVIAAASEVLHPIVAVDVGGSRVIRHGIESSGFAGTYMRGLEIVMQSLTSRSLATWTEPSLVLIRPDVDTIPMFAFDHTDALLDEGYRAGVAVLDQLASNGRFNGGGVYPRTTMQISIDPARCVGCGICIAMAPKVFRVGSSGKAEVIAPRQTWSPVDGAYVLHCPTYAINANAAERRSGKHHRRSGSSPALPDPS